MVHALAEVLTADNVHVELLKCPPTPPSLHDTVPVGMVGELLVSVTFALKVIVFPRATDDGFGVMVVAVERGLTVNADWPKLEACVVSPE